MKKLIVLLLLVGCGQSERWRVVPTTDAERAAVRSMIYDLCVATTGNSQPEDAEDVIAQAEQTAIRVICKPTLWRRDEASGEWMDQVKP